MFLPKRRFPPRDPSVSIIIGVDRQNDVLMVNSSTLSVFGVGSEDAGFIGGRDETTSERLPRSALFGALSRPGPRAGGQMGLGGEKHGEK